MAYCCHNILLECPHRQCKRGRSNHQTHQTYFPPKGEASEIFLMKDVEGFVTLYASCGNVDLKTCIQLFLPHLE